MLLPSLDRFTVALDEDVQPELDPLDAGIGVAARRGDDIGLPRPRRPEALGEIDLNDQLLGLLLALDAKDYILHFQILQLMIYVSTGKLLCAL
jgi:hypothetical protein